jgi:hypothetical protein
MAIMDLQLANNFSIVSGLSASRFPFGKGTSRHQKPNKLTGIGFIISSILSPLTPRRIVS